MVLGLLQSTDQLRLERWLQNTISATFPGVVPSSFLIRPLKKILVIPPGHGLTFGLGLGSFDNRLRTGNMSHVSGNGRHRRAQGRSRRDVPEVRRIILKTSQLACNQLFAGIAEIVGLFKSVVFIHKSYTWCKFSASLWGIKALWYRLERTCGWQRSEKPRPNARSALFLNARRARSVLFNQPCHQKRSPSAFVGEKTAERVRHHADDHILEFSRRYWNELSLLSVNANVFDHE